MKALVLFLLLLPILLVGSALYFFLNQETKNPSISSSEETEMNPKYSDRNWTDVSSKNDSINKSKEEVNDRTWWNRITKTFKFFDQRKSPVTGSNRELEITTQNIDRNWSDVHSESDSIKKSKRKVDDRTWRNTIRKEIRFYDGNEDRKAIEKIYKGGLLISAKSWKPNGEKCPETNISDGSGIVVDYRWEGTRWFRLSYKNGLPIFK